MKKLFLFLLVGIQCALAGSWHIEAGAAGHLRMQCEIRGSTCTMQSGMRSIYPSGGSTGSPPPLDNGDYADREFLDGYVKKDPGTGNAGSLAPEYTWFWGYANDSQYNVSSGILTFHTPVYEQQTQRFSKQSTGAGNLRHDEDLHTEGLTLSIGYDWIDKRNWTFRWTAGLAIYNEADMNFRNHLQLERGLRITDIQRQQGIYSYDTGGISMPAPGYQGTYDGPFATPPPALSPLLPNRPSSITNQDLGSLTNTTEIYSESTVETDCDFSARFTEIRIGGKSFYEFCNRLQGYVSLQMLCALVECEGDYHEQFRQKETATGNLLTGKNWRDSADTTRLLLGISCGTGLEYRLTKQISLGTGIQRKQYFDKVKTGLGAGEIELDFSCVEFEVYISWHF